jgi:putative FmdB family regulatory protein
MPIYEFYCADCHTIFNFFARTPNTTKRPKCPRCGRPELDRKLSRFAISKGRAEPSPDDGLPADLDEAKMERLMAEMANEGNGIDEDDPRQMARMMRKLGDATGMNFGGPMEEAIRRMESGEDPDKIEEEMGELLDTDQIESAPPGHRLRQLAKTLRPAAVDDTLYDL